MRHTFLTGLAAVLAWMFLSAADAAARDGTWYVETEAGFETGDFGTDTRSNLYSLIPTVGYITPRFDLALSAPLLYLDDDIGNAAGGVGDVFLEGGMVLWSAPAHESSLVASLGIKLPTADAGRGLGTGEVDVAGTLTVRKFFDRFGIWGSLGYLYTGDPPSGPLNNLLFYEVGTTMFFRRGSIYTSFEGRSAVVSGAHGPKEIHLGGYRMLTENYSVRAEGFAGLNDGGSDLGGRLALIRWF